MDWLKAALSVDWKKVSLKKVSLHGVLGAVAVYGVLKAHGAPDSVALTGGLVSGLTSTYASGADGSKEQHDTSTTFS